jgi:hypothetical protein
VVQAQVAIPLAAPTPQQDVPEARVQASARDSEHDLEPSPMFASPSPAPTPAPVTAKPTPPAASPPAATPPAGAPGTLFLPIVVVEDFDIDMSDDPPEANAPAATMVLPAHRASLPLGAAPPVRNHPLPSAPRPQPVNTLEFDVFTDETVRPSVIVDDDDMFARFPLGGAAPVSPPAPTSHDAAATAFMPAAMASAMVSSSMVAPPSNQAAATVFMAAAPPSDLAAPTVFMAAAPPSEQAAATLYMAAVPAQPETPEPASDASPNPRKDPTGA